MNKQYKEEKSKKNNKHNLQTRAKLNGKFGLTWEILPMQTASKVRCLKGHFFINKKIFAAQNNLFVLFSTTKLFC